MPSVFRRPISPNERLYLAGRQLSPPFAIHIFVEGDGALDLDAVRAAAVRAGDACPGARLVARGAEWVDGGTPPPVRAVDARFDAVRFDDAPFLWSELDPERGPTCELLLLRGNARATLLLRVFHGTMDGKGALVWLRALFGALRGETPAAATSPHTDHSLLAALGPTGRRAGMHFDYPSPLGPGRVTDTRFFWRRRTLPGRHPALVAKLGAILGARSDAERLRFMVPVDLRRHAPALASTANLSLPLFLEAQRGDGWETLHQRLLAQLAANAELVSDGVEGALARLPAWGVNGLTRLLIARQRQAGRYLGSAILSHLGRLLPADFSAPGFAARTVYSLPVHAPLVPLSLVATELDAHVELTLSAPEGAGVETRAEQLLDDVEAALVAGPRWAGNRTAAPFPERETATSLWAAAVARAPAATALVHGERTTTYAELDRRANVVAAALAGRGVGPGALVGLMTDRTEEAVAALLGIWKLGAAWVPIDPHYPDERVAYLLADAGAALCVAASAYAARAAVGGGGAAVLTLEALDFAATPPPPWHRGAPGDLAYVIYTSGSTGRPKGVAVAQRSLVNYLDWARREYDVGAATRFALFTSLSFDLSITALVLPLVAGGSVALFPEELDHLTLGRVLGGAGANALKLTPTHLQLIGRLDARPVGFRTLVVGGEQLRGAVAARAQAQFGPACRIVNEYGPTEATVGCVIHRFDGARDDAAAAVPIGRPAANTRILLLDPGGAPVAVGDSGEIFIAGAALARGYWRREALTAERFVQLLPDGERAYRTGDLARIDGAGNLEFLGRSDDQVKIRGHRIEPGEVEAVLEGHPAVARAVVVGRARPGGDEALLCAWFVARTPVDEAELRAYLAERLPAHLVPAFLVAVADIARTVHGKVDVRALPDPFAAAGGGARPATPGDQLERAVAAIWARVLGVDGAALGPGADFHRLGGDSLKMIDMLAAVSRELAGAGREADFMQRVRPLLGQPTLDHICRALADTRAEPA